MFSFILARAWAWALPYVGPLLPPILRNIPAIDTVKRWIRRAFIAALVVAAIASLYVLFKSMRNPVAEFVSAAELQADRNRQLTNANATLQKTLDERELEAAAAIAEAELLRDQLEKAREKSPDPDAVVFPADDPWLRAKQRR